MVKMASRIPGVTFVTFVTLVTLVTLVTFTHAHSKTRNRHAGGENLF